MHFGIRRPPRPARPDDAPETLFPLVVGAVFVVLVWGVLYLMLR